MTRLQISVFMLLSLALAGSMLTVVNYRQQGRELFIELQTVRQQLDEQEILRSRLQLEQSTLANIARVKRLAIENLAMHNPQQVLIMALPAADQRQPQRGNGS